MHAHQSITTKGDKENGKISLCDPTFLPSRHVAPSIEIINGWVTSYAQFMNPTAQDSHQENCIPKTEKWGFPYNDSLDIMRKGKKDTQQRDSEMHSKIMQEASQHGFVKKQELAWGVLFLTHIFKKMYSALNSGASATSPRVSASERVRQAPRWRLELPIPVTAWALGLRGF